MRLWIRPLKAAISVILMRNAEAGTRGWGAGVLVECVKRVASY